MANKEKYELAILISPTFKKDLCYSIYNMYDTSWEIKRLYYRQYKPILLYSQHELYVMANKEKYELAILISPTFKKRPTILYIQHV